jgi:hypothetical protein
MGEVGVLVGESLFILYVIGVVLDCCCCLANCWSIAGAGERGAPEECRSAEEAERRKPMEGATEPAVGVPSTFSSSSMGTFRACAKNKTVSLCAIFLISY